MATPDYRARLKKLMNDTVADEAKMHDWTYHAVRPMYVPPAWEPGQRIVGDCSKGVQYLCRWAGCADPMGMNYGPYGNSSTLWAHLQHLKMRTDLQIGDIVTFGPSGSEHAAMVLVPGTDPLVWSFGHQGAPDTYHLSVDKRQQQFLRNPLPVYIPTPQDKLKVETGYWAWVAWKLGEGDWAKYGAANKSVRPNVPNVIPTSWWYRFALFLKNRESGNKPTTGGA